MRPQDIEMIFCKKNKNFLFQKKLNVANSTSYAIFLDSKIQANFTEL